MTDAMKVLKVAARVGIAAFALAAGTANAEWFRAETNHFVIYSEDTREGTIAFATELERFDNALRTLQAMPIAPDKELSDANKVTIFREGRVSDIATLAGAPGSGIAGFYIPRAGAAVAFTPISEDRKDIRTIYSKASDKRTDLDPRSILQHEYVHHFMLQTFPATYPDWYVEAFAELYATVALNEDGSFHVGNPPQYRSYQIYNLPTFSLKQMFDQNHQRKGIDRFQFYGTGWLIAHYLSFNEARKGQLVSYLKALDRGEDGLTAARAAFGDLDQLQKEVNDYKSEARRGKLPGYALRPANYVTPSVDLRSLDAAEESVINLWMRSRRGVDRSEARKIANAIEGPAGQFPTNAFVQTAAAEAFLDARRYADADAAADRALAIKPDSIEARLFKGMVAHELGKKGDKAKFAEAREHFAEATKIDPTDPRPYMGYYDAYRREGGEIPENALVGLESVFQQAAFDGSYRTILGWQLLSEGKGKLAKNVLAPITFSFHGDQEDNKLRKVVDLIDENKTTEAFNELDKLIREAETKAEKDD